MHADNAGPEHETLKEEAGHIIEEARMVLPGIQALFGFQMVAVFNQRFVEVPRIGIYAHLVAIVLIVVAIVLIMTPAAYHRIAEPARTSQRLIRISSRLVFLAMIPLLLSLILDIFVVFLLATAAVGWSALIASGLLAVSAVAWFAWPCYVRCRLHAKNPDGC